MIATTTRTTTTTARPVTANASRHGATSAARACVGTRGTSDVVRLTSKDAGIARGGAIARARSTMRVHGGRRSVVTMAGGVAKAAPGEPKKVFGLTLPESEGVSFAILAAGSLGSALGFAASRGRVPHPGFQVLRVDDRLD